MFVVVVSSHYYLIIHDTMRFTYFILIFSYLFRSSSKLKTELCFWGEVYEFSGLPAVSTIHVNVYKEPERRARKRDKHALVGEYEK